MPPTPPPPLPAPRTCGRKSQSRVLAERCSFAEKGLTHNFHVLKVILSLLNCQMGILRIGRNMFCQFPPALVLLPGEQGARGYYGVPVGGGRVTGPVQRPHQRGGGGGRFLAAFSLLFVPFWKLFGHHSVISANVHQPAAGAGSRGRRSGAMPCSFHSAAGARDSPGAQTRPP